MPSSSGKHYIALDHIRGLATYIVFVWHFTHNEEGYPIPFAGAPSLFPFSLLDEGHTGVALFMTLSGYLFAKLLDGKAINYWPFLWNRALRLVPLLGLVMLIAGFQRWLRGDDLGFYLYILARGFLVPSWPNGGWSIAVEIHFYLILPLLLWLSARANWLPLTILVLSLGLRTLLFVNGNDMLWWGYWTLVGRIDQFVLGMLAFSFRQQIAGYHGRFAMVFVGFMLIFWWFNLQGGFFQYEIDQSLNAFWVILPTLEGFAYATLIGWYDHSFQHSTNWFSQFIALFGKYSYSIYLLHFFFVFAASRFVHEQIMPLTNFYVAYLWATGAFILMLIPSALSYHLFEAPFLRLRKRYIRE